MKESVRQPNHATKLDFVFHALIDLLLGRKNPGTGALRMAVQRKSPATAELVNQTCRPVAKCGRGGNCKKCDDEAQKKSKANEEQSDQPSHGRPDKLRQDDPKFSREREAGEEDKLVQASHDLIHKCPKRLRRLLMRWLPDGA